jgi:uncharacterized protein (DUF58 family)
MGRWYTGLTLGIGAAAINTGNNLLFLLLGLLLAGIVLSGVLSESTLRGVSLERLLPRDAQAGRAALVGLRVTNGKDRLGSFALVLRDVTGEGEAGHAFVLRLEPGESRDVSYRWEPKRRGRVAFERLEIATRFPFGLFEKWREIDAAAELVVFPREVPAPGVSPRRVRPHGERASGLAGPGHEFFGLRDATDRDDARQIHWRTSARRGRPVVVERERENRRRVVVSLDNRVAGAHPPERLDWAAEEAAALVRRAAGEGCEVGFSASGLEVPPGTGPHHERRILSALGLLAPVPDGPAPRRPGTADVLEITAESDPAPAAA